MRNKYNNINWGKPYNQEQIDRKHLEWLVLVCLSEEKPPITIGKGKELLGYRTMNEMRDFMNKHFIDGKMK